MGYFLEYLSVTPSEERNGIWQDRLKQYPNRQIYENDCLFQSFSNKHLTLANFRNIFKRTPSVFIQVQCRIIPIFRMTFAHQVWSSSSRTNQTEAFDAFIAWKVNPRTDSENATNYSQSFLPTSTKFIQQTTFHLEFNVNLNNQASILSTPLSQSRSTLTRI